MDYTFLVRLPKHLETAYKAGKIIITDGVARDISTKKIVAHLEQVAPLINNTTSGLSSGNPYIMVSGMGIDAAKLIQGSITNQKLDKVIAMVQNLQMLSYVNIAITGINIGVSIVGFAIVISKLNQIDHQLMNITHKLEGIIRGDIKIMIREVSNSIKDSISLVDKLSYIPLSEYFEHAVEKQLNKMESLLNDLISRLHDDDIVNVPLPLIQALYNNYANLLKVYLTSIYLSQKNIKFNGISQRLNFLKETQEKLVTEKMLEYIYEDILISGQQKLSESEIDIIQYLYEYGCQQIPKNIQNHHKILIETPINKFQEWKQLKIDNKKSLIWISH
ncbi:MAG: hypothetical protein ACXITR_02850 [Cyanobacterium sp.]